jgi:hypothetical protein
MGKIDVGIDIDNVFRFTKDAVKHAPASPRQKALCRLWNEFRDGYRAESSGTEGTRIEQSHLPNDGRFS